MKRTPRPGRLAAKLNQIKVDVHIVITFSKSAPRGEKGLQTTEVCYRVPMLYNMPSCDFTPPSNSLQKRLISFKCVLLFYNANTMKIAVHIYQFLSRIKIHTCIIGSHSLHLEIWLFTRLESFITCKPNYFSL